MLPRTPYLDSIRKRSKATIHSYCSVGTNGSPIILPGSIVPTARQIFIESFSLA